MLAEQLALEAVLQHLCCSSHSVSLDQVLPESRMPDVQFFAVLILEFLKASRAKVLGALIRIPSSSKSISVKGTLSVC